MVTLGFGCCGGHKEQNERQWPSPGYHLQRRSPPPLGFFLGQRRAVGFRHLEPTSVPTEGWYGRLCF